MSFFNKAPPPRAAAKVKTRGTKAQQKESARLDVMEAKFKKLESAGVFDVPDELLGRDGSAKKKKKKRKKRAPEGTPSPVSKPKSKKGSDLFWPSVRSKPKAKKEVAKKDCGVGRELNPASNRCRKSCDDDQTRNAKGRCTRLRIKRKPRPKKKQKNTPEADKDLNCEGMIRVDAYTRLDGTKVSAHCRVDKKKKVVDPDETGTDEETETGDEKNVVDPAETESDYDDEPLRRRVRRPAKITFTKQPPRDKFKTMKF